MNGLNKFLVLGVLLLSNIATSIYSQQLSSENEVKETMLFFLHKEAIQDRYGPGSDFLKLRQIFMPYLAHVSAGDMYNQASWNFDGSMFQSFVFFENFYHRNYNAGANSMHLRMPEKYKLNEYLNDIFGCQQRKINHYHTIIDTLQYSYYSDKLPESVENNNLTQSNTSGPNFLQGLDNAENSTSAVIGEYAYNGIVQNRIPVTQAGNYIMKFHVKGWWHDFNDHCLQCVSMGIKAYDENYNRLFIDDPNGFVPPGESISSSNPYWSDLLQMHIRTKGLNDTDCETTADNPADTTEVPSMNWKDKNINEIYLSPEVKYIDLFIFSPYSSTQSENWRIGNTPVIAVDDVYLGIGNSGVNIVEDSGFAIDFQVGQDGFDVWEKCMLERDLEVYEDEIGFLDALLQAYNELEISHAIDLETIDIFLTVPDIDLSLQNTYLSDGGAQFQLDLEDYASTILEYYNNWKTRHALTNPPFRIAGFHICRETSEGDYATVYFEKIKAVADQNFWTVLGIPYTRTCSEGEVIKSRYRGSDVGLPSMLTLVPLINQQPNAFAVRRAALNKQIVDHENLHYVDQLLETDQLGMHIEHQIQELEPNSQPYPRLIDYLDYGKRSGYVNYRKSYIDDEGDFFNLAFSDQYEEKRAYDDIFEHMQLSKNGYLLNAGFEHSELVNGTEVLSDWEYSSNGNTIPVLDCHDHGVSLSQASGLKNGHLGLDMSSLAAVETSERIPIDHNVSYACSAWINSSCGVDVSIIEYNQDGIQINTTNLTFPGAVGQEQSLTYTPQLLTRSVKLKIHPSSCNGPALIDRLQLLSIPATVNTDEWNQDVPLRVSKDYPAFLKDQKALSKTEPLTINYSARFQDPDEVNHSDLYYEIGIQFYDIANQLLTYAHGDSLGASRYHELMYHLLPDVPPSSYKHFVFDTLTNSYQLSLKIPYYGKEYACVYPGSPCVYLGCGVVSKDPDPADPMDTWYTSQTIFNSIEIPLTSLPANAESYRLFYMNTNSNNSQLVVHRPWLSNLQVPYTSQHSAIVTDEVSTAESNAVDRFDEAIENEHVTGSEETRISGLTIYPNPSTERTMLEWEGANTFGKSYELEVHNMMGKLVFEKSIDGKQSSYEVQVSDWSSGLYVVSLKHGDGFLEKRLLEVKH